MLKRRGRGRPLWESHVVRLNLGVGGMSCGLLQDNPALKPYIKWGDHRREASALGVGRGRVGGRELPTDCREWVYRRRGLGPADVSVRWRG